MASLVFNWGWWHTVNHRCLSAAPGKPVCTSGSRWACFLEINALQCSWWNYYPFQMSSMAAFVWSADYHKQHYSCTSAPTWADVLPEVRRNLITIMHSILEGKKLFGVTQGRKANMQPGVFSCLQELLSGKTECNSFWYPGTWLGEDPSSYPYPGSLLSSAPWILAITWCKYAKEPRDKAVRSWRIAEAFLLYLWYIYVFLISANCLQCCARSVKSEFQIKIPSVSPN